MFHLGLKTVDSVGMRLAIQGISFVFAIVVTQMLWQDYRRSKRGFQKYLAAGAVVFLIQAAFMLTVFVYSTASGQRLPEAFMPMIDHALEVLAVALTSYAFIFAVPEKQLRFKKIFDFNLGILILTTPVLWSFWYSYLLTAPAGRQKFAYFWVDPVYEILTMVLLFCGAYLAAKSNIKMRYAFILAFSILIIKEAMHTYNIITSNNTTAWLLVIERFLQVPYYYVLITAIHSEIVNEFGRTVNKNIFQAALLEQVHNAVVVTDLKGKIVYWNKFAENLYRTAAHEVIGKSIRDVVTWRGDTDIVEEILFEALEHGYWEGELVHQKNDGPELFIQAAVTQVKNINGKPIGLIAVAMDITEKKEMEKQFAHLDQLHLVGEMAASIGHEIRNPLTAIRGFLQLMAGKEKLADEREFLYLMMDEADRANAIITEFLSLAKDKRIERKKQNVNDILLKMMPLLKADAAIADKTIQAKLNKIDSLFVDEKEIRQLVLNLVRNGLEAMPPGGVLEIETFEAEKDVVLAVRDEGEGIATEVLDKIGTPFVTTKEDSTGLGLAVCYSIASRHNATISVNTGPVGTTFFIRFKRLDRIAFRGGNYFGNGCVHNM